MRRNGFTNDPCHGCGEIGMRRKDQVCVKCAALLAPARKRESEIEERGQDAAEPFFLQEKAYALPYIGHCERDPVLQAFFDLSMLVSEPTSLWPESSKSVWPFSGRDRGDWAVPRLVRPLVAAALRALFSAVRTALDEAHAKGHQQGRDLLRRLASGEMTADDFNNQAMRIESPR